MPVSDLVLTLLLASTAPVDGRGTGVSLAADSITQPNGGAVAPAPTEHFVKGKVVFPSTAASYKVVRFHKGRRIVGAHKGGLIVREPKGRRVALFHKGGLVKPKVY